MTSIPINAADRECLIAEIDALVESIAELYDGCPNEVQAAMLTLGHSLSSLRRKIGRPVPVRMASRTVRLDRAAALASALPRHDCPQAGSLKPTPLTTQPRAS